MAETGLGGPPPHDRLADLPTSPGTTQLHRLSEHPTTWWFVSAEPTDDTTGGRFDLSSPNGTCYTAESLDGALVEKLLRTGVKVVPAERLGELFHATIDVRRQSATADLTDKRATGFGLNNELHSTLDYRRTRRWANAIRQAGWRGLRYLLRGDVAGTEKGRALFGRAGLHRRAPAGMRARVRTLDRDVAERMLAARTVEVRPIPETVPLTTPDERSPG